MTWSFTFYGVTFYVKLVRYGWLIHTNIAPNRLRGLIYHDVSHQCSQIVNAFRSVPAFFCPAKRYSAIYIVIIIKLKTMYYLLGLNKDAIYFMAFSILYGCIVELVSTSDRIMYGSFQLCSEVWTDNLNMVGLITLRTNVPLQTAVELSNHRAEIYAH